MSEEKILIGGQAVIEGVMMRNKSKVAVAVRQGEGNIVVHNKEYRSPAERYPFLKYPLLRGVVVFIDSLILGVQTLSLSAEQALDEEEEGL